MPEPVVPAEIAPALVMTPPLESDAPVPALTMIAPLLVTAPFVPEMKTPYPAPVIEAPAWLVTLALSPVRNTAIAAGPPVAVIVPEPLLTIVALAVAARMP